jgi:hypothetical protein
MNREIETIYWTISSLYKATIILVFRESFDRAVRSLWFWSVFSVELSSCTLSGFALPDTRAALTHTGRPVRRRATVLRAIEFAISLKVHVDKMISVCSFYAFPQVEKHSKEGRRSEMSTFSDDRLIIYDDCDRLMRGLLFPQGSWIVRGLQGRKLLVGSPSNESTKPYQQ